MEKLNKKNVVQSNGGGLGRSVSARSSQGAGRLGRSAAEILRSPFQLRSSTYKRVR